MSFIDWLNFCPNSNYLFVIFFLGVISSMFYDIFNSFCNYILEKTWRVKDYEKALYLIKKNIDDLVVNSAKDTLILTAMSQNGVIDFIVVLANNFRMIKKIIVMCGFRPTFMRTMKLYTNVFFSSLIADGAQKLEMSSLISSSLTGLSKVVVDSLGNGAVNALFMLRIGMLTKNYLYIDGVKKNKFSLRNSSILEACKLFPSVIMSVVTSPIKSVAKIFSRGEEKNEEEIIEEEIPEVKWKWRLKKERKVR